MNFSQTKLGLAILKSCFKVGRQRLYIRKKALGTFTVRQSDTTEEYILVSRLPKRMFDQYFLRHEPEEIISILSPKCKSTAEFPAKTRVDYLRESLQFRFHSLDRFACCQSDASIMDLEAIYCLYVAIYFRQPYLSEFKSALSRNQLLTEDHQNYLLKLIAKQPMYPQDALINRIREDFNCHGNVGQETKRNTYALAILIARNRIENKSNTDYESQSALIDTLLIDFPELLQNQLLCPIQAYECWDLEFEVDKLKSFYDSNLVDLHRYVESNLGVEVCVIPGQVLVISCLHVTIASADRVPQIETISVVSDWATKAVLGTKIISGDISELRSVLRCAIEISGNHLPRCVFYPEEFKTLIGEACFRLEFFGVEFLQGVKVNRRLDNFLKYFNSNNKAIKQIEVVQVAKFQLNINVLFGDAQNALDLFINAINEDFNNSKFYASNGTSSPLKCFRSMKKSSLHRLTEEQYAILFFDLYECKIVRDTAFIEQNCETIMFEIPKGIETRALTGKILCDTNNLQANSFLPTCAGEWVKVNYKSKYVANGEPFPDDAPVVIDVKREASRLLRIEFDIDPPGSKDFDESKSRRLRRARYALNKNLNDTISNQKSI